MTLEDFLAGSVRNAWIKEPGIEIYVRKFMNRFDVANIQVDESMRGRGVFTAWLTKAEGLVAGQFGTMMVENVHNPILIPFLVRHGYIESFDRPYCFIKHMQ